jgi:hypothetical protein
MRWAMYPRYVFEGNLIENHVMEKSLHSMMSRMKPEFGGFTTINVLIKELGMQFH